MRTKFLLTKTIIDSSVINSEISLIMKSDSFALYGNENFIDINGIEIFIDGFVVPRNNIYAEYKHFTQHELVFTLYKKYGYNFPKYLKGFFCILIANKSECILVNDIHSVKRCFIAKNNDGWFITNILELLRGNFDFRLDPFAPALQAIFQHLVEGRTMYDNIKYTKPSSILIISEKGIEQRKYFDESQLISSKKDKIDQLTFFEIFENSVHNYIEYLKPANVSATLTGGRDTRSILSVLMHIGIKPHCFTFGYPSGIDVITAKNIADICDLRYSNHNIEELNSLSYNKLIDDVISINNPFIHIHRAHRLDAIQKEELEMGKNLEMVFVGAMGGDYITGEKFNDYILSEFLRRYLTEQTPEKSIIKEILEKHFVKYDEKTIEFIQSFLNSFGLKHNVFDKQVEFSLVHNIIGCTHDIQDINLFLEHSKYVIAPFMDIDIMEALFSSPFSLFNNKKHSKNPFLRLKGGELQSALIKRYSPVLASVNFANQYSPNDVLGNRLKYVLKRIYFQTFKAKSNSTFSYDNWFVDFVNKELETNNQVIAEFYNLNSMKESMNSQTHETHEGYWHKFSNPLMFEKYLELNKAST